MPVIGVTGGIASGKSTVTRCLVEAFRIRVAGKVQAFSADECGHRLLQDDGGVVSEVTKVFGQKVLDAEGRVSREALRNIVFSDESSRKQLESVLHPKIHQTWMKMAEDFRLATDYLVAEIPLLYETNSDRYFDCVVVVEAGVQVQVERLSSKRGWSLETARRVIDAQMPAEEKMRRADLLILNQYTEKLLADQIELAATALLMPYA